MSKKGLGKKYRGEPNIVEEYKIGETVMAVTKILARRGGLAQAMQVP